MTTPTETTRTADAGTLAVVTAFNAAFNAVLDGTGPASALDPLLTEDCVFDGTAPPDGELHTGRAAVRAAFDAVFGGVARGRFATEEVVVAGDRAVVRWRYDWVGHDGAAGHVRGVDLFTVRGGRVAEKLAYVKG